MRPRDETDLQAQLRAALADAMRSQDRVATLALRSVLSAISNAEAVVPAPGASGTTSAHVAGAAAGLGAAEAQRRRLTPADITPIVQAEISERLAAARGYEDSGHPDRADRLRAEASAITAALPDIPPPSE